MSEVGLEVLQAVGSPRAAASSEEIALRNNLAALQQQNRVLQEQLAATEATRTAALAQIAAAHASEITHTKGLAVRKIKQLMEQIEELEASQVKLSQAHQEAADAAQVALKGAPKPDENKKGCGDASAAAAEAEVKQLMAELARTRTHLAASNTGHEAAQAEVKRLKGTMGNLEVQLMEASQDAIQATADTAAKLATKDAEIASLQGKLDTVQESLKIAEDCKRRMEAAEKAMGTLKLELRKESILRKKAYNQIREMKGNIRVLCRVRPAVVSEGPAAGGAPAVAAEVLDEFTLGIYDQKAMATKKYEFDTSFPPDTSQEQVYEETQALLQSALDGYNVCIFCYGQTGSGKTHTITGSKSAPGIIPRAISELFSRDPATSQVSVSCYMLELYQVEPPAPPPPPPSPSSSSSPHTSPPPPAHSI